MSAVRTTAQARSAAGRSDLRSLLESFGGLRALVVGEAMLDSFLKGPGERLSREAPVPIVDVIERTDVPGGAANTAANVRALGSDVTFISVIGDDLEGALLRRALEKAGLPIDGLLMQRGRKTLAKHRLLGSGQMIAQFDQGTTAPIPPSLESAFIERLSQRWSAADVVIVADFGSGLMTPGVRDAIAELRKEGDRRLVVDGRDPRAYASARPTAVKPKYDEAAALLGLPAVEGSRARTDQLTGRGEDLLNVTGSRIAAVTLDADGALVFERGHPPHRTYTRPMQISKAAVAGDTFTSVLGLALAAGATMQAAAELASAASAVVVAKEATTCSPAELRQYLSSEGKYVGGWLGLRDVAEPLHRQGKRIVFTNGYFDILHRGHVAHLAQAKALGDVLVIGLNSDESIRRAKGRGWPITSMEDRIEILAALDPVDYIIPFDGDTPVDLISALRPHVYVKGADHADDRLPETTVVKRMGGDVVILPLVTDFSTSTIVDRVRRTKR